MVEQPSVDPVDWVTIWQSELAALAVDRECHERVAAMAQAFMQVGAGSGDPRGGPATGRAGPDAAPGAPSAGLAPGASRELDDLRRRVAELERAARHSPWPAA